jgi:hypothetical protein
MSSRQVEYLHAPLPIMDAKNTVRQNNMLLQQKDNSDVGIEQQKTNKTK